MDFTDFARRQSYHQMAVRKNMSQYRNKNVRKNFCLVFSASTVFQKQFVFTRIPNLKAKSLISSVVFEMKLVPGSIFIHTVTGMVGRSFQRLKRMILANLKNCFCLEKSVNRALWQMNSLSEHRKKNKLIEMHFG